MAKWSNSDEAYYIIEQIGANATGVITTKQIEDAGIYRGMIRKFVEDGRLIKEAKGLYSLASEFPDEYFVLQKRSEKMIFSYGAALYLWGMSDRVPHNLDVTVPQGFNSSRIKKDNPNIRFHYVKKDKWEIGITETNTVMGNKVFLYDKERCICDLIMVKKEMDKQIFIQAIKEYFNGEHDLRKIISYAKAFGIEEKVRDYMDVLT